MREMKIMIMKIVIVKVNYDCRNNVGNSNNENYYDNRVNGQLIF